MSCHLQREKNVFSYRGHSCSLYFKYKNAFQFCATVKHTKKSSLGGYVREHHGKAVFSNTILMALIHICTIKPNYPFQGFTFISIHRMDKRKRKIETITSVKTIYKQKASGRLEQLLTSGP